MSTADTDRSPREQAIAHYADRFACDDIDVQATVHGYETPRELNGVTPDLLAVGARTERAFVIVTDADERAEDREALREWADGQVRRLFRWGVLTDDGTVDHWRE